MRMNETIADKCAQIGYMQQIVVSVEQKRPLWYVILMVHS